MSVRTTVTHYLRHRFALWERRRTERFIRALPLEIQKDIGWRNGMLSETLPGRPSNGLLERRW